MGKVIDAEIKKNVKMELTKVYRYLFAYNVIVQEKHGLEAPRTAIKPGAIEIELFDKVRTTVEINAYIKKISEDEHGRQKLANPNVPEVRFLQVTVFNIILLDAYEREIEVEVPDEEIKEEDKN